ncbi:unnamed protein product [Paramecium pentaurelia]|uniref:Uncharacterized protein n=1 Tax=Paramecium pentaurelia TaxID=43138 RepID=A0A8S1UYK2_9CILI|nr:unnamed protein product [Paramecium pentaurelia]
MEILLNVNQKKNNQLSIESVEEPLNKLLQKADKYIDLNKFIDQRKNLQNIRRIKRILQKTLNFEQQIKLIMDLFYYCTNSKKENENLIKSIR